MKNDYLTFVPAISITRDCISLSVIRFMWPLRTYKKPTLVHMMTHLSTTH